MGIGNAIIGALRVNLGLDSASFTAGLKLAEGDVNKFGKLAKISFGVVAGAAAGLAVALAAASKRAVDHADEMGKMAQKAGVSTEALSRLNYAAQLSDVSLEGLTGGLQKLSKSMLDAATNTKGTTATAFDALGVSVTDSSGKLRDAGDVFTDIADRFTRIGDGATKTALSMTLFGKSGAELIPLLNSGANELHRMADESDRTGNTISGKAAAGAERFNDALTGLGQKLAGIVNRMVGGDGFQAALDRLSATLTDPKLLSAAEQLGELIANGLADAIPYIKNAVNNLSALRDLFSDFEHKSDKGQQNAIIDLRNQVTTIENRIEENKKRLAEGGVGTLFGINDAALKAQIADDIAAIQPLIDKIAELQRARATGVPGPNDVVGTGPSFSELQNLLNPPKTNLGLLGGDKVDALTKKIDVLKKGLGSIGPVAADAQQMMQDSFQSTIGSLGDLTGALSNAFKENKGIAVANAIVNGLQGISYALASPFPANLIGAAAVGIQAAANVANIMSTNESSTSFPTSGGAASAASSSTAVAATPAMPAIHLSLKGSGFTQKDIENLVDQINEHLGLGGKGFVTT